MIVPKGQAIHENLDTSFTNFNELLAKLKADSFVGYIRTSFWEYEAYLLFDHGDIVNAIEEAEHVRQTGVAAVNSILSKSKQKDGVIGVYALSEEMVTMLASVVESEPIHKALSSNLTQLDKLIAQLEAEQHTGFIEVALNDRKGNGLVLVQAGDPIEVLLTENGNMLSGKSALPRLIELSASVGATFNVFRADIEKSFGAGTSIKASMTMPRLLSIWQEILAASERITDSIWGKGHFVDAFKDTLSENKNAEAYPFLDPFAGGFDYANGKITFTANPTPYFSEGVGTCLHLTLTKLASEKGARNFTALITDAFQELGTRNIKIVQEFNLETYLTGFLKAGGS